MKTNVGVLVGLALTAYLIGASSSGYRANAQDKAMPVEMTAGKVEQVAAPARGKAFPHVNGLSHDAPRDCVSKPLLFSWISPLAWL